MTAMQPYTPLREVEGLLYQSGTKFKPWKDGSISFRVPSDLPLLHPIEYTFGLAEDKEGIVALVMFGLPLSAESIEGFSDELNLRILDLIFEARPHVQILTMAMDLHPERFDKDMHMLQCSCDFLYPLITAVRRDRDWSKDLVSLFLMSPTKMVQA